MVKIKEPMKITIEVIPHSEQRYETCGDWVINRDTREITIRVSELDNWKYELLVGLHEMVEVMLCFDREISAEEVDKFDMEYELNRDLSDFSEPGDHPDAPYRKEHFFATSIERLMAAELKVDWQKYEQEIERLGA